ncbi:hypothetical protein [Cupriavidus pauculus]|uniref:hypothetical protein n=1 Tax=Cupriavidus pauculus TaxID=82633 RepID=UPI0011AF4806|nr:hypothetical protein [Cupriavidus pauculus]
MGTISRRIASPVMSILIGIAAFLTGVAVAALQAHLRRNDAATAAAVARSPERSDGQWMG